MNTMMYFLQKTHIPSLLALRSRQVFSFFFFCTWDIWNSESKRQSQDFQFGSFWHRGQFWSWLMMLFLVPWIRVECCPFYLRLCYWFIIKDGVLPICTSLTYWLLIDRAFLIGQWPFIAVITYFYYCFCFYINIEFFWYKKDLWQFVQMPYTSKITSIKSRQTSKKKCKDRKIHLGRKETNTKV